MRKTTKELALEAGCEHNSLGWTYTYGTLPELLETFRRLCIENERECAEAVAYLWQGGWLHISEPENPDAFPVFRFPPAAQVPEGYRLVPINPTPEMLEFAGEVDATPDNLLKAIYKAMLAAAPEVKHG